MITLTKKFEFEAAHRISNYEGPCREIHGHTYKLEVTISGPINPKTDMILDFKILKNLVKISVIEQFDHALLLKDNEENRKLFEHYSGKITWMKAEPTAEPVAVEVVAPTENGEMTAEDFAAMVERARAAAGNGGDDCEMCGS